MHGYDPGDPPDVGDVDGAGWAPADALLRAYSRGERCPPSTEAALRVVMRQPDDWDAYMVGNALAGQVRAAEARRLAAQAVTRAAALPGETPHQTQARLLGRGDD